MKIVTYKLEDMQEMSELLNVVSQHGINLEQAKALALIAEIIDNRNLGIKEVEAEDAEEKPIAETEEM